jgi:hypothetical protein
MTDQAAGAAPPAREATLPRSVAIIEAFRSGTEPADELLRLAARLARRHQDQWAAETVSRNPSATAEQIAGLPQPETRHEIHVLQRRHGDPLREARASVAREAEPVSDRYAAYQEALATVVALQAGRGTEVVPLAPASVLNRWASARFPARMSAEHARQVPVHVPQPAALGGEPQHGRERQRPAAGTHGGLRSSKPALVAAGYRRSGMTPIVYPHAWRSRRAVVTFGSRAPVS